MNIYKAVIIVTVASSMSGTFSCYAPGLMERTIGNQQGWGNLPQNVPPLDCALASRECADVGRIVWVRGETTDWIPCLVADCASKHDRQSEDDPRSGYEWMRDGNIIAELDYDTYRRLGKRGEFSYLPPNPYSKGGQFYQFK